MNPIRDDGLYLDALIQAVWFDSKVDAEGEGRKADFGVWGLGLSAEAGWRIPLSNNLHVIPRVQVLWNGSYLNPFTDVDGTRVVMGDDDQLSLVEGVLLEWQGDADWAGEDAQLALYGLVDLQQNLDRTTSVISSGPEIEHKGNRHWARIGGGWTLAFNEKLSMYGGLSGAATLSGSMNDSHGVQGHLGMRVRW